MAGKRQRHPLYFLFLLLMLLVLALGIFLYVAGISQGHHAAPLRPHEPFLVGGFFRHA